MEHHQEQRLEIASQQQNRLSLTSSEILIKQCAQTGTRIGTLDARSIGAHLTDLVKRITVITGLKVDDSSADMFAQDMTRFLLTYYSNITIEEIKTAFYLNANEIGEDKVIFYGSFLTLEHIGRVLTQYKAKRAAVVKKINAGSSLPDAPPPTKEEQMVIDKNMVNEFYRKYLHEELKEVSMAYAFMIYDIMKKLLPHTIPSADIRRKFHEEAIEFRREQLITVQQTTLHQRPKHEREETKSIIDQLIENVVPRSEEERIINIGKERTLMHMFNEFSKKGIKTIF
jgi:hypothetical protein